MTDRFLPTALRRALEKTVKAAREVAEAGAADAVRRLGVAEASPPAHLNDDAKALRRRLRAHARTLGDVVIAEGVHEVRHLVEATGYAQWHRRLFARFLAERGLLRHPEHGPVTLEDCEELARLEGLPDAWTAAEGYGAKMLPGVFLPDDPVLALVFAPEHSLALRQLVDDLDAEIFQADDALGWTYQFWRAAEKDRVNKAGEKIGARDLPAVTQLFTEPYMVKFLLHNTLGAWRAGKVLAAQPALAAEAADEVTLRLAVSPPGYAFDMLRFVREGEDAPRWRPAAGTFPGWPETAAAIRALDPCCGSGHFLTEMLAVLSALRADEEGLADAAAVAAVLSDNLFGLELDGRCVQIAAFAVALTAWRIGGFQPFGPEQVHIAWVGAPPPLDRTEFEALGNGDGEFRYALGQLHDLFRKAPVLGSLLEPTGGDLLGPRIIGKLEASLPALVERTRSAEPERAEGVVAARGMADALAALGRRYTLIGTNVPFLGRGKQDEDIKEHIERYDPDAKTDLATAMLSRILRLLERGGTVAAVTPQNWLFLGSYKALRSRLLEATTLNVVGALGPRAFETISGEVVNTALMALTAATPDPGASFVGLDANEGRNSSEKQNALAGPVQLGIQAAQFENPDQRISTGRTSTGPLLSKYATAFQGLATADYDRFGRLFWERPLPHPDWDYQASTVDNTSDFNGLEHILWWEQGNGALARSPQARIQGLGAKGGVGVCVSQMRNVPVTRFLGTFFDNNCSAMTIEERHLPALWAYCSSSDYAAAVRQIDQKLSVTNATLTKVPFDLDHWARIAATRFPNGLPEPYSDDPTQWLFHGHPAKAEAGTQLHVALARLAGYRWPAEGDPNMRLSAEARTWIGMSAHLPAADKDGILCVEAVAGEQSLAQRLRSFLAAAFGAGWSDDLERRLVAEADQSLDRKVARDGSLETWLRDRAFRQHCRLFHERPFLWQVWDGSPDGFSAFAQYHRLDTATLSKLTYTVLGDWIARMTNAGDARRIEAAKILQQKLTAVLDGEAPFDIFVRWKALEHQPVGWGPDLDDGVRFNIRPFVRAGVLQETPKIKWGVDRGSDAPSAPWFPHDKGKRNNDRHLTLADKQVARGAK